MPVDSRIPFLFWTDAPDKFTGLARICRDLAMYMCHDEEINKIYRVGSLGFFGSGSAKFPWTQYTAASVDDGLQKMPDIWEDFTAPSGDKKGVLFSITPPTWIFNLFAAVCETGRTWRYGQSLDWLAARPYHHWAYLAIESCTPGPKFSLPVVRIIQATDRNLFYSRWGAEIASLCTDIEKHEYMPHGIFCGDFTLPPLGTRLRSSRETSTRSSTPSSRTTRLES